MFKQKVKVSNPEKSNLWFENDFWIDTGAIYTLIPQNYLNKIQFEPESTRNIVLADGRTDRKLFGFCKFEIEGQEGKITCPVIAGVDDSVFLLGATALENFSLEVDPVNKRLHQVMAIMAGFIVSK